MSPPPAVGPFQILGEIGKGSMGTVYLARKGSGTELGRPVALKRLHPEHLKELANLRSFVREAEIGITLNHHNVVAVQELIPDGEGFAITMEYVDGVDLRRILRHTSSLGQRLPLPIALEVLEQACLGLDHAHQPDPLLGRPSLVHRDFKPANVMVTRSGLVKVMDFGIARLAGLDHVQDDGTAGGTIKGTPRYMSPEQARGEAIGPAADIFSAGLVLFECVTGERFYRSSEFLALLREAQEADVAGNLRRASTLPRGIFAALRRALDPDPARRHGRALDLAEELRIQRRRLKEGESLVTFAGRICETLAQPARAEGPARAPGEDSGGSRAQGAPAPSISTLARGWNTLSHAALSETAARAVAAAEATDVPEGIGTAPATDSERPGRAPTPDATAAPGDGVVPADAPPVDPPRRSGLMLVLATVLSVAAAMVAWMLVLTKPEQVKPIELYVDPPAAVVSVGGKDLAVSESYRLPPPPPGGTLEVLVRAEGFAPRLETLRPEEAGQRRMIALEKKTPSPP
ncbi:serine/threonine protein kinase [Myxococcota bacterium]|nr:serine/threonine protein kinase [Myxococcota bacterium]